MTQKHQRTIVTIPLPEWARRFEQRCDETLLHHRRTFDLAVCSGPAGSQMAFEEQPGLWVLTCDQTIKLEECDGVTTIDAQAIRTRRAMITDRWFAEAPHEWERLEQQISLNLPYAFNRLEDGSWRPINRYYEPLGLPRGTWADKEAFPADAEDFRCDPRVMDGIWSHVDDDGARAFLYSDDPASRRDYFTRLLRLDEYTALPGEAPSARGG